MQRPLIACLLITCASSLAWAESGRPEALRVVQHERGHVEPAQLLSEPVPAAQVSQRRIPQFQLPEHTYASVDANESGADRVRRGGRLSAEERRALRQQINEVGIDLYAPRR